MATRNELEARKDRLEAELARREASRSTSERQAAYVTGRGRSEDVAEPVEDRDEMDDERDGWDEDVARHESGSSTSRRQAARVTRGASRRGDS